MQQMSQLVPGMGSADSALGAVTRKLTRHAFGPQLQCLRVFFYIKSQYHDFI